MKANSFIEAFTFIANDMVNYMSLSTNSNACPLTHIVCYPDVQATSPTASSYRPA